MSRALWACLIIPSFSAPAAKVRGLYPQPGAQGNYAGLFQRNASGAATSIVGGAKRR